MAQLWSDFFFTWIFHEKCLKFLRYYQLYTTNITASYIQQEYLPDIHVLSCSLHDF